MAKMKWGGGVAISATSPHAERRVPSSRGTLYKGKRGERS